MIKFVDMFSGIGGFREGLSRAGGFECVGHCEIDKYANRSYNALFDTKGEWFVEDARKADPETMPEFRLLCGGFPCQTFSIAGSRKGFGDPRGTLFFELARLAEARKPAYLLFENVPYVQKCIRYILYNQLLMSEKLYPHLLEIERTAQERVDTMLPHMMETAGVTEELKACDPMRWVGLMNTLTAQIEEILIRELICS